MHYYDDLLYSAPPEQNDDLLYSAPPEQNDDLLYSAKPEQNYAQRPGLTALMVKQDGRRSLGL